MFKDSFGKDDLNMLYALNTDGSLYKTKVIVGDGYSTEFDMADMDAISKATAKVTAKDVLKYYDIVKACNDGIIGG